MAQQRQSSLGRSTDTRRGPARPPADPGSTIGASTRVRGKVRGEGGLRVAGQVDGEVGVDGDLEIDEGGGVRGNVEAASVTVRGTLHGDVTSRGAVAILATADVEGTIGGSEVSLEEGASFRGRIEADFELPPELAEKPAPAARGRR